MTSLTRSRRWAILLVVIMAVILGSAFLLWRSSPQFGRAVSSASHRDEESADVVATVLLRRKQYVVDPLIVEPDDFDDWVETQRSIVTSRRVLGSAVEEMLIGQLPSPTNMEDPMQYLMDEIKTSMKSRDLMEIYIEGDRSTVDQRRMVLEQVLRSYIDDHNSTERASQGRKIDFLRENLNSREELLKTLRSKIRELNDSAGPDSDEVFFAEREFARELEVYDRIAMKIKVLQTNQVAPVRVELIDAPGIRHSK